MPKNDNTGMVQSDMRLLAIVTALQELDGGGVTEIGDYLDMKTSTVHKHLKTLHHEEFVQKQGSEYHLGFKFLDLGTLVQRRTELIEIAKPHLQELAEAVDELVTLSIKEFDYGVYLHWHNDKYSIGSETRQKLGQSRFELHTSSAGKSILSELNTEQVQSFLDQQELTKKTENTITDRQQLLAELEEIREQGFAINRGERINGVMAIGSGFYSPIGDHLAAISIAGPARRFSDGELKNDYADALLNTVNEVEVKLKLQS